MNEYDFCRWLHGYLKTMTDDGTNEALSVFDIKLIKITLDKVLKGKANDDSPAMR
jgi:hypothetical protein